MTALTDRERQEIRRRVFQEKRADSEFMKEVISESDSAWHKAFKESDWIQMGYELDLAASRYIEKCGLYEEAEADLLAAIECSGGRKWFYGS